VVTILPELLAVSRKLLQDRKEGIYLKEPCLNIVLLQHRNVGLLIYLGRGLLEGEVKLRFRALLPQLRGPLIGRWDGGSMHRGPAIEAVCQAHPRLSWEACPAYAPARNPLAPGWNAVNGHLANSLRRDTRDLRRRLSATTRRVRRSQAKLRSFIRRATLPSPP
jgi:hypothetical protein